MKKITTYTLTIFAALLLIACGGGDTQEETKAIEAKITKPKALTAPQGVVFDYSLFEYNFDEIPAGANPVEYTTDPLRSGKHSFALSEQRIFGPNYIMDVTKAEKGQYFKVSFDCYKEKETPDPKNMKGNFVISCHRGDSTIHYEGFSIYKLLKAQNKQFIQKWETLELWYQVPEDLQVGDKIKFYHFNPKGGNVYLDNFKTEIWTKNPIKAPSNYTLSHNIAEQNYETKINGQTKETAARGIASQIISKNHAQFGAGYIGKLADANAQAGDYIRVRFYAFRHNNTNTSKESASLIGSIRDEKFFYHTFAINPRIRTNEGKLVKEWVELESWFAIPQGAKVDDILKIYTFNPYQEPIYIDDLRVEVWKAK